MQQLALLCYIWRILLYFPFIKLDKNIILLWLSGVLVDFLFLYHGLCSVLSNWIGATMGRNCLLLMRFGWNLPPRSHKGAFFRKSNIQEIWKKKMLLWIDVHSASRIRAPSIPPLLSSIQNKTFALEGMEVLDLFVPLE